MHFHNFPKNSPTASSEGFVTISSKSRRRPPTIMIEIFDPLLQKHINIHTLALMVLEFGSTASSKISQL